MFDVNHQPIAGAQVSLYLHGGVTPLAVFTTGADGKYLFTTNDAASFVPGGEYDLREAPPAGYATPATDLNGSATQLSTLVGGTASSFDIQIPSPTAATVDVAATFGPNGFFNNFDVLSWQNGVYDQGAGTWSYQTDPNAPVVAEQFPTTVNGHTYLTLCTNPGQSLDSPTTQNGTTSNQFPVSPTSTFPSLPSGTDSLYSGRIAYLFNEHGTQTLDAQHAVGLQLAVWTLLYDSGGNLDNGNFQVADFNSATTSLSTRGLINISQAPGYSGYAGYSTATFAQEEQQAATYINESYGKNQAAWYLAAGAPTAGGHQSLIGTDSFNFTNVFQPSITTTPSPAVITLTNGTPPILTDSAVLSGGYSTTGTITFTLVAPGGATVDTETVNVNGNGTYTTPTGYALPSNSTVVGTYQWNAVFTDSSGNNSDASDLNASSEQVSINKASPSIATTPSPTSVTLGASSVTLTDSAVLSGGYSPTGTIIFTLVAPGGATVDTETVSVNGNGTYTTPTGYTLPSNSTVVGSYQWNAVFTDSRGNNFAASDVNDSSERVSVKNASPSINTTPSATGTPGNSTISGTKFLDITGNGFSGDDTGLGGVTINLYQESNSATGLQTGSGGDTLVGTTTTASDGTYSFANPGAGTYYVQEAVPSGYIQTGGGSSGLAGNAYYKIIVAADTSYAGYNFDDFKIPTCAPSCVTYTVTHNGCSTTVTDLTGQTHPGDTVTVHFTVPAGMNDELTLVSYYAPQSYWSDSNAYQQLIYQQSTGVFSPGAHSLTVKIPSSYYQIDFVCGKAIDQLEPNQSGDAYGPDSSNILYHAQNRYLDSDSGGSSAPSALNSSSPLVPAPTATPSPSTYKLNDSATLSGGYQPGGTITFYLFAPGATASTPLSAAVYTDTVAVSGNGVYDTTMGDNPGGYAAALKGTYQWVAVFSGDGNNSSVTSPYGSEPFTIAKASPAITTTPQQISASCVSAGQFATIGFWHNCNGQAVIDSFNGSQSSTALGNWLATNWPNLFGASNPYISATLASLPGSPASLAGLTNSQIAMVYENLWTPSGVTKNTYVQAFAVALGLYADTTSLGGQSLSDNGLAAKYGFVVTATGAGTFNVGSSGAAFGVPNNTVLSVQQILSDVDGGFDPTTGNFYGGNQTLTSAANYVLNGINTTGDIPGGTVTIGSGIYLTDTAALSGGDHPTGTITFTLYGPDGSTVVDTETVSVNGDGAYYTPGGYLATATGTYQWVASYSGDANNNPVSGKFGDEPVIVGMTALSLTTTPGSTVILGSGNKLSDSATLSGGFNPTGSIVFTLYDPNGTAVYADTVTVNGNGAYSTSAGTNPGGYLPTMVGMYQWVASYSGDSNNSPETGSMGDEPESVVSSICISGTKFLDLTGNGFSTDDQGLGGVTIMLFQDANNDGKLTSTDGSPVATTVTASDGTYRFANLTPGTYFVQESVPAGYIQTGGGPNGSAGAAYYKVVAAAGSTYSGNNFDDARKCDLSQVTCVSYAINGCKPVSTLGGNTHQGDTVKVTFTYTGSGPHDFTLVSYSAPGSSFDASNAYLQQIYQENSITVNGPGTYSLAVKIPNCFYQIDFVCGDAIDQLGPTGAGPDQSDIFYTPQSRLIGADNGGTQSCSTVACGDFATVDFWHNRNGQALINCLNGGPHSTELAKWLVTTFPNLYGNSSGSTCLVNQDGSYFTNSQIANAYLGSAFYGAGSTGKSRWGWGGWSGGWSQAGDQTNAQILSAALSEYVTNVTLAGGNMAAKYGFNTSFSGTGCDVFNVGSNGAAFGVPNYTNCSVHQLLCYVNSHCSGGSLYGGNSSLKNQADSCISSINSGGNIAMLATGSDVSASSDSQLALTPAMLESGQIWVTIDGLDPVLGAQQEAALDAGIASLNAQLSRYGVTLVDVTGNSDEAAMADINVHLCDTSAIGGVSDGVLGLTLLGGNVTLVDGWNWYYGADPMQIGAAQYDFQTVATHELGHAIGLGHSTDANSVMYPYLSAGEVRRDLTASDLSIIDQEVGSAPEPLLAGHGLSAASEAAIGALFGMGVSPPANLTSGAMALTSSSASVATSPTTPWSGIALSANRRALFAELFDADDNGLADALTAEAADAADELYQAAVDVIHSFFG